MQAALFVMQVHNAALPRPDRVAPIRILLIADGTCETMGRRCVMQTTHGNAHPRTSRKRHGPMRRMLESIADACSPLLTCNECGTVDKQRHFARTGETRSVATGREWTGWTAIEVEYRCPSCEASVWVVDVPTYYPMG